MDFLLDTHTLIWMMEDDPRLPTPVANLLTDETHELWLSTASFWEISIKRSLGKLNLSYSTNQYWSEAARQGIRRLPIELNQWAGRYSTPAGLVPLVSPKESFDQPAFSALARSQRYSISL